MAATILARLTDAYESARDPEAAAAMGAYMREQFPFLGIRAPRQTALNRVVLAGVARGSIGPADLADVVAACLRMPEREYRYFAIHLLRRHVRACPAEFLGDVRAMILDRPWWDTIDPIAAHVVGPLVAAHPRLLATMDAWARDDDKWLVRTAILHQLGYHDATDTDRLFGYCTDQAGHPDFFVRKAIGWALRQYARTDPDAVRSYVHDHPGLSGLSKREALLRL
jgi:3-methyladenine DNA glycosylase AlkD